MRIDILDVCCGSRAFWFRKDDNRALFVDKRVCVLPRQHSDQPRSPVAVKPDVQCDFRHLPFKSGTFPVVVYDPPHMKSGATGNIAKYYGTLGDDWRDMLRDGFSECFRVLKSQGTLIFKWNEISIKVSEILKLTNEKPLLGHKTGKLGKTHWIVFINTGGRIERRDSD